MQELRSTEILDKEIQADARKKAGSILQKADLDCAKLLESLDDDIEKTRAEKELAYSKKLAAFEQDQKAAIPLQKECFEVSFIQNSIVKNINEYLIYGGTGNNVCPSNCPTKNKANPKQYTLSLPSFIFM